MTNLSPLTIDDAPEASQPIMAGATEKYSFLPNLLGTMAHAPAMLKGYATLAGIFDETSFSPTEQQIVLMSNNLLNGCGYCMAAHTTIAAGQGVPEDVVQALRDNTPIADTKLEALRQFSQVINISRGNPNAADVEAFLAAGYNEANVLEVILGTALKVMSNYTNHIAKTPVDANFSANAWTG